MSYAIEINQLSHKYGQSQVLTDVNLSIPHGTVAAVLGENGAGKTTLVKSILGYIQPTSGTIKVLGLNPKRDSQALKRVVGYVPDQPIVQSWMTVNQVGWFASAFFQDSYAKKFSEIANGFKLPGNERFSSLSKGMKAKVSLTLALAMEPNLLVLDEPTSGLDLAIRRTFLEELVDKAAQGKTVWVNSHQVSEVERVADWIVVVADGKVQLSSPLEEAKSNHRTVSLLAPDPSLPIPQCLSNERTIAKERFGRQWRVLVRDLDETHLRQVVGPNTFELQKIERPSLEELYLGYTANDQFPTNSESESMDELSPALPA